MPKVNKFRTVYTSRDEEHKGIVFCSDSLAQQQFKDECDVNRIVDRYVRTGLLEHLADVPPHYADVSDIPSDLMAAYDAVDRAEAAFMALPSDLRKELNNDPIRLGVWLCDEANRDLAVKYGLLNPVPTPEPTPEPMPEPTPKVIDDSVST